MAPNEHFPSHQLPVPPSLAETKRRRRRALWCSSVAVLLFSVLAGLYMYTDDSGRWASRKYARAMTEVEHLRNECDHGLQESRLGRSPPVSHALCVKHAIAPAFPKHENALLKVLAIGDWGRDGMCCQRDVAMRMDEVAQHWKPEFIINTGDNF